MMTVPEFSARKGSGKKITLVTCYDASFARVLAETEIDALLVGDSLAMVMQGFDSTVHCTPEMIAYHTQAVARGAPKKFLVADMPFLSASEGPAAAARIAGSFLRAGAHAVKIEGIEGHEETVRHLVREGIPVMGHLGLTPQSVNVFGGMKVQGKTAEAGEKLFHDAKKFQDAGAFALVLECIPEPVATRVTAELRIPTIGIGAGRATDGQVLVLQDLLGFNPSFKPKFLRRYLNGFEHFNKAFGDFHREVQSGAFPSPEETYG